MLKAIELTEFACSLPQIVTGEVLEVSRGVECRTDRYPIGVVASIVPFNFPSMVPHWTIPNATGARQLHDPQAIRAGAAERRPDSGAAERRRTAAGVFNVVHGGQEIVEAICDHPGDCRCHLRRINQGGQAGVPASQRKPQARARPWRRQEPPVRAARCQCRDDLDQHRRVDVRVRRPALHGGIGDAGRIDRPTTSSRRMVEQARSVSSRVQPGSGHLAGGQAADRALHRVRRYRPAPGCCWTDATRRVAGPRRRILDWARRSSIMSGRR